MPANKHPTFQTVFGKIPCKNRTGNSFVEPGILFVEPGNFKCENGKSAQRPSSAPVRSGGRGQADPASDSSSTPRPVGLVGLGSQGHHLPQRTRLAQVRTVERNVHSWGRRAFQGETTRKRVSAALAYSRKREASIRSGAREETRISESMITSSAGGGSQSP